ncbi:MAG: hypothetical protein JNK63_01740 [Chthonomonas sp.]|nr:hypothetical protein [Chthonomonas sp.]
MKVLMVLPLALAGAFAHASDHNNIEAGRPLSFDDAYSIAYGERALELGFSIDTFRRRGPDYGLKAEYKVGFAKNQDLAIAFHPHSSGGRGDFGDVEIGYFHGVRREVGNAPALGYRVDVALPTGRDSRGVDVHLRGVATKALRQYDKVHLNLDLSVPTDPAPGERSLALGAVLGYSTPLGYPRSFDQTLVAEFALNQSPTKGEGPMGSIGLGLRKQMSPRAVFDVGLSTDLFGPDRTALRFAAGYSVSF